MDSPKINELVVYRKRREPTLGIVLSLDGDAVSLFSEDGKRYPVEGKKLVLRTFMSVSPDLADPEKKLEMRRWRRELEEKKASVDVETLWECVVGERETVSFGEIFDLYSGAGEVSDSERLSLFWAVDKNTVYLGRTEDGYAVRSREEVSRTLRAAELREERERKKKAAGDWARSVLGGEAPASVVGEHREFLEMIERYLVDLDGYERAKETREFLHDAGLKEIEAAVEFLVKTGFWEKDDDCESKKISLGFRHSERALGEVAAVLGAEAAFEGFTDRTDLEVFSVDSEETRDIDDAVSLERSGDGITLGVHISNVASVVERGGFLDKGALERSETVYFPEGSTGMFPHELVEERLSLSRGELRPALSLFASFDGESHELTGYRFENTLVRVSENLSYGRATEVFRSEEWGGTLLALAASLRRGRIGKGAFLVQLPELKIRVGEGGAISAEKDRMNSPAHEVVSECMILMNRLSGDFFAKNAIPAVFRSQTRETDPEARDLDPADVLFPVKVIKHLRPSAVSLEPEPHRSIGVASYVQTTSPIRRYMDLLMQRQLVCWLRGQGVCYAGEELEDTNMRASLSTREIKNAQRSRHRYWLLRYLLQEDVKGATGYVSSRGYRGFNVYVPEFLLELPLSNAGNRVFEIGEEISVSLWGIDPLRRRIRATPE